MTWIRIALTTLLLFSMTACDVLDPQADEAPDAPSAAPTSFELQGRISMEYTLSDVHTCEDVLLADLPAPTTGKEVRANVQHLEAQSQIDLLVDRNVTIRDAEEEEHLATVSTDDELVPTELEEESASGTVACVASTSFGTVLPPVDNYIFVVRGITGTPEPVSYEDLQSAGFVCDIRVDAAGGLADSATCGV